MKNSCAQALQVVGGISDCFPLGRGKGMHGQVRENVLPAKWQLHFLQPADGIAGNHLGLKPPLNHKKPLLV